MLLGPGEQRELPGWATVGDRAIVGPLAAGHFRGRPAVAIAVEEAPDGWSAVPLRAVFATAAADLSAAAGRASQLVEWARAHTYCGRCGTRTEWRPEQPSAMTCPNCGALHFPRINPAVITVVHRGDEILLAHNLAMAPGYFALVAGFVEAGETLEDAVRREVLEEVGIEVEHPVYQGSQPWPFPSQLMAGFFASYRSGEIVADESEIGEAQWFHRERMPDPGHRPPPFSIAGRL
ncbi:MAG: NAD(+) diphosphatase, partial [Candidatus Dormiibacterota bacterium]